MSDPNDAFFKKALGPDRDKSGAEQLQAREANFEESVVKAVLTSATQGTAWWKLAAACKQRCGSPTLTLDWFREEYPQFPVLLGASLVPWVYTLTLRELMDGFLKTKVFQAYKDFVMTRELDDDAQFVGVVFRDVRRMMVLHNYPREVEIDTAAERHNQGSRIVCRHGTVLYTLERFENLLGSIDTAWYMDSC